MDAVTYPKQNVIDMLDRHVIPVRTPFDGELAREFEAKWTPFLLFLDTNKKAHHKIVGFLPPEELIPAILLGVGKTFFDAQKLDRAMNMFDEVIKEHPSNHAAPEAVYFRGVSEYKKTHSAEPLKQVYERLRAEYPETEWAKRAAPYRLL
jgi:thioredoxin-related protein